MHINNLKAFGLFAAGGVFAAGVAFAADARFDEAEANVNKAIALVKAAEVPADKRIAERKRQRAIAALEHAKRRIACAKEAADGKVKLFCKSAEDDEDERDEERKKKNDPRGGPKKDDPRGPNKKGAGRPGG